LQLTADMAVIYGSLQGLFSFAKKANYRKILSSPKQGIFIFLVALWIATAFFNIFYNIVKTKSEVQEWVRLNDVDKRQKIFGDLYNFFTFISSNTQKNETILIYSKDQRTFYLGTYYLYPRHIVFIDDEKNLMQTIKKQKYTHVAIYNNHIVLPQYKLSAKYAGKTTKDFGILYKKP
jgi:hypothetical protein